jgi:O-antigen ligase
VAGIVICRSRRRHVLALAVTVLIAVTGVLGLRAYKLNTRSWEQVATLQSATARMYDFGLASRMFREHPLFGRGYGTFKIDYYNALVDFQMRDRSADLYVPHLSEVQGRPPQHVHDDYFEIALETGVVGLVLFLGILAWTAARLGAVILRPPAGSRTWLALALGCALLAILSDATMSFPLNLPLTASLFWCLLALAHRLVLEAEAEGRIQPAARAS